MSWLTALALALTVVGYDHVIHDGYVEVKGIEAPTCSHCHALDKRLAPVKPGHATCFGGKCHVFQKQDQLCLACHDSTRPAPRARMIWAGEASRDFGLTFPHDQHKTGCLACHVAPGGAAAPAKKPVGAHDRCVACHKGKPAAFAMSECARCHRSIAGRFEAPAQVRSAYAVGASFSHDRHLARQSGPAPTRCLACHAEVEKTSGVQVPAPTMQSCEGCHDGKQAFAALGNRCRLCHTKGDALPGAEPPRLFDHRQHVAVGAPARCDGCHVPGPGALTLRPVDHTACNDARCHAAELRSPAPRICGGCHVGTEPWRPLRSDAPRRLRSELGAEFNHGAHLAAKGLAAPRSSQTCSECHTGVPGGLPMRLGRGHGTCAGEDCHARAKPLLGDCDGCHRIGILAQRDERRASSRWSTAERFRHAAHERDGLGQPVACVSCHAGVLGARQVAEIPVPRKADCTGCHDGILGFKMTGHACGRCHEHAATPAAEP